MKTTGFGELEAIPVTGGNVMVAAFSPVLGHFELVMSADELMLFLVEAGNVLALARRAETQKRAEDELQREERR